jgi:hypothetical protein
MKIDKTCPKCGYDDTVLQYFPQGDKKYAEDKELFSEFGTLHHKDPLYEHVTTLILDRECVKVHCRTCHYEWVTGTMDAKSKPELNAFGLSDEDMEKLKTDFETPKGGFTSMNIEEMFQPFKDGSFDRMFEDIFVNSQKYSNE